MRQVGALLLGVSIGRAARGYRRRHLRWGATPSEVESELPGDSIISRPRFDATRAITIEAPPEAVWPWLVQVGFNRAGFYSYDLLDNLARPSADRILPEFQATTVGDWIPMASTISDRTAFRVGGFERNRWLLWRKPDSTWVWKLTPAGEGRTRLVTRIRVVYDLRSPLAALASLLLLELGDFPMMRKMLYGLRARAERIPFEPTSAATAAALCDAETV